MPLRKSLLIPYFALLIAPLITSNSCAPSGVKKETGYMTKEKDFPEGYTNWKKVNETTIFRVAEGEAREIYFSGQPSVKEGVSDFPDGSLLVKEQYRLIQKGAERYEKGELFQINVMERSRSSERGWKFKALDPYSKNPLDTEGCVICHSKRKSFNYLFSDFGKWVSTE